MKYLVYDFIFKIFQFKNSFCLSKEKKNYGNKYEKYLLISAK